MRRWAWHFLDFRVFAESTIYGFYICVQNIAADFDVRTMVETLLQHNQFEKLRARTMDIDDFLR